MFSKSLSKMAVMTALGVSAFTLSAEATDKLIYKDGGSYAGAGSGHTWVGGTTGQIYVATPSPYGYENYTPNPTYYTQLPHLFQKDYECYQKPGIWTVPAVRWTLDPNYYAVAPDHGWSPPGKWAIHREAPVYRKYYPDQWYGTGKYPHHPGHAYPVVAQPTDTTQLGYYYQTVPQWQPRPGMLPPPPNPREWHRRQYEYHADGTVTYWAPLTEVWVPLNQMPNGAPVQAQPTPAKVEEKPLPKAVEPEKIAPMPPAAPPAGPAQAEVEQQPAIQQTGFLQRIMKRK